jgi:hypothetical protein
MYIMNRYLNRVHMYIYVHVNLGKYFCTYMYNDTFSDNARRL